MPALAAILLPVLYWDQGVETLPALKRAGVECVHVPAERAAEWKKTGFCHVPVSIVKLKQRETIPAPTVQWKINEASATRAPWIDANGWRFLRAKPREYYCEVPAGAAELAAAEAHAYNADVWLKIDPKDLDAFGRMLAFLRKSGPASQPTRANIALIDDDTDLTDEVMNLLARRNLLFRGVLTPDPKADLNVRIGTPQYPKDEAANPAEFASKIRRLLTDEKRLLRIYGSEVVIARLTGDPARGRLYLLNYVGSRIEGLRVRVRGSFRNAAVAAYGFDKATVEEFDASDGTAEFTIPEMGVYAIVDLQ